MSSNRAFVVAVLVLLTATVALSGAALAVALTRDSSLPDRVTIVPACTGYGCDRPWRQDFR